MLGEDLSLVAMTIGNRGSNKTLLLTHFDIEFMARAWVVRKIREMRGVENGKVENGLFIPSPVLPKKKVNVWSYHAVKALYKFPFYPKAVLLSTIPLNVERLMTLEPEYCEGYIVWDEIDQAADRQDWMATLPKMLVKAVKVFRHRNLSLWGSLQFMDELNIRLYKQADIVIQCRDLAYTPWGKEKHLAGGQVANTVWIDKSGVMTGYSFEESHQIYPMQFMGERYWHNYQTLHDVDIMEFTKKYRFHREVKEIVPVEVAEQEERDRQAIYKAIEFFRYDRPGKKVQTTDFIPKAQELGCTWKPHAIGVYMRNILGVTSTKYQGVSRYDLSQIELDREKVET